MKKGGRGHTKRASQGSGVEQTEKALRIRTEEQEVSERVVWKLHLSVVATLDFCGNGEAMMPTRDIPDQRYHTSLRR